MAVGALLATAGYVAFYVRVSGRLELLYLFGVLGVILFVVGLVTAIRGR
jgi:hypothetical protein